MVIKMKMKMEKGIDILLWILILTFMFLSIFSYVKELNSNKNKEQKYIVRYGEIISPTEIITEDGNIWGGEDFPQEKYVRVLFDSNETETPTDDIIIDITEDARELRR